MANYELRDISTNEVIEKKTLSWSQAEELNKSAVEKGEKWMRVDSSKAPPVESSRVSSTPTPIVGTVSTADQGSRVDNAPPEAKPIPSQEKAVKERMEDLKTDLTIPSGKHILTPVQKETVESGFDELQNPADKLSEALNNLKGEPKE